MILIFISFEETEHAEKFARYVIDMKLAACVQIIPVKSFYTWKEEKVESEEVEAIVKTTEEKFSLIEQAMKDLFSYEIPQLIAIKSEEVNAPYMRWVKESFK